MLRRMSPLSQQRYTLDTPGNFRIFICGMLDQGWSDRLGGLTVSATQLADGTPATILAGELADQSALVGVLNALHDLGLPLMSVERMADAANDP